VRWLARRNKTRKQATAAGWRKATGEEELPPLPNDKK